MFPTVWQGDASWSSHVQPLIAGRIGGLIYWPLRLWVFAVAYVAVFLCVIALWLFVRPRRPWQRRGR